MSGLAGDILLAFFREAWLALGGALVLLAGLGLLAQVLKVAGATALGARYWAAQAVSAGAGLIGLGLFAFLGVPAIVQAVLAAVPGGAGCGPIGDLGALAASIVGALAGLRMLKALLAAAALAAAGGAAALSTSLTEVGEALLGMLLAAAAVPVAAHFLGVC